MFRFGFGFGFNTGKRRLFGAVLWAKAKVVAALSKVIHSVASADTSAAAFVVSNLKVISKLEAQLTGEGLVAAELPSYDSDYAAVLARAVLLGDTEPLTAEKIVHNQLMVSIKGLSTNGLATWSKIRVYGTNKNYAGAIPPDLGYTGINWANPAANQSARINTITQVAKKGYHGNSVDAAINENWNPATSGIPKDDFLWFSVVYTNGFVGQAYMESLFNATFTDSLQLQYYISPADTSGGRIFSIEAPSVARAGQITAPGYIIQAIWRDGADVYLMLNGVQHGPFNVGSDTPMVNDNMYSLCRSYVTGNRFDFLGDNIIKTAEGFGKQSEIDKSALHSALVAYISTL